MTATETEETGWRYLGHVVLAIVVLGTVARLAYLGIRPLHHDESLDAWFSWRFLNGTYEGYDPVYHGPLRFYVIAAFYWLFGVSDSVARLLPALAGSAIIGLPWFLRRQLGPAGTIGATTALCVSPSFLYFSRFGREDAMFALLTFGLILLMLAFHRAPREWHPTALVLTFVAALAVKESTFLLVFLLGSFVLALAAQELYWATRRRPQLGSPHGPEGDVPWVIVASMALMVLAFVLGEPIFVNLGWYGTLLVLAVAATAVQARGVGVRPNDVPVLSSLRTVALRWWLLAIGVGVFVYVVLFTVFFSTWQGADTVNTPYNALVDGLVSGFKYWRGEQDTLRGDARWFYYLALIPLYEWFFVLLAGVGTWRVVRRRQLDGWFFLWFAVTSVTVYSWAGERMPWLIIHPLLPIMLLAGYGTQHLWEHRERIGVRIAAVFGVAALVFTMVGSFQASFVRGDDPRELFVQAGQTHQDVPDWVERSGDLDRLVRAELGRPLQLVIDVDYAWPYVWSLRDRTAVSYPDLGTDPGTLTADVVIASWPRADLVRDRLPADTDYIEIPYVHRVWWVPDYAAGRFTGWLRWVWDRTPWDAGPGNFPGTVFVSGDVFDLERRWLQGE